MATKILSFPIGAIGMVYDNIYATVAYGVWNYDGTYNGLSKIVDSGGNAIDDLLQGIIVDEVTGEYYQNPAEFGGLMPDNSANGYTYPTYGEYPITTTMPNSNKPLITHLIDAGLLYCFRIAKIESDNVIWVEDPEGNASSLSNTYFYGINQNLAAMTKVKISATERFSLCLPSQTPASAITAGEYTLTPNTNGIVEPFLITSNDGSITITITQ